jgi:hypothetical protein
VDGAILVLASDLGASLPLGNVGGISGRMPERRTSGFIHRILAMTAALIIRYDWNGAHQAGIKEHPQRDLDRLGVRSFHYEAVGIADCAFIEVDRLPDPCPPYIELAGPDYRFTPISRKPKEPRHMPIFSEISDKKFPGSTPFLIAAVKGYTQGADIRCTLKDKEGNALYDAPTTKPQLEKFWQACQTKTPYYGK